MVLNVLKPYAGAVCVFIVRDKKKKKKLRLMVTVEGFDLSD